MATDISPRRWFLRAVALAAGAPLVGGVLGAIVGHLSGTAGMAVVAVVALLVVAPLSTSLLGRAGLMPAFLFLVAGIGGGLSSHKLALGQHLTLAHVDTWQPWRDDVVALEGPALRALEALTTSARWETSSGKGHTRHEETAVPLVDEAGAVVAFTCFVDGEHRPPVVPDRSRVIALDLRFAAQQACEHGVEAAATAARAAGYRLVDGAQAHVVRLFDDEQALRRSFAVDLTPFVVCAVLALVFVIACALAAARRHTAGDAAVAGSR